MAKKKTESANLLDLTVAFGNISVGDKTARVGVEIDRGDLSVSAADKNLCEKRLTGTIIAKPPGVKGDQGAFPGMEDDTEMTGIFDVKGVAFSSDQIRIGLTFALASIHVETLAKFAKRAGRLVVQAVDDIPEPVKAESNGEHDDEDKDGDED